MDINGWGLEDGVLWGLGGSESGENWLNGLDGWMVWSDISVLFLTFIQGDVEG